MEVKQKWRFAFIVHPRNLDDVFLKYPLLRSFPPERVRASLEQMPPCLLSPVMRFNESEPKELGWLLAILLTPDLIEGNPDLARQKIHEAITAAKQAGATLVGLGGWNASLARDRQEFLPYQVTVTTGLKMTVATILSDLGELCRWKGIPMAEATVAVVGSAGAVGRATILELKGKVKSLVSLSAQEKDRSCVREADLVVVATRALGPVLHAEDFKEEAILYDVSQPSNLPADLCVARPDLVILQGGLVKTPGIDCGPFLRLPPETAFACLAETVLLALEGKLSDGAAGIDSSDRVNEIAEKAQRYGFVSAMKLDES